MSRFVGVASQFENRITVNPLQMSGQPCIRGTRLTVYRVMALLATYPSRSEVLTEFPDLEEEDLVQALEFVEVCMQKLSSSNIFLEVQQEVDNDLRD
jgi:uncharacterized protein (DUF433 family)